MSVSFSIGGVTFAAISKTSGRKALAMRVPIAKYQLHRYHVPGVDGNYVVRSGRESQRILCILRYQGTSAESNYETDREAWANTEVTIVDEANNSLDRCNVAGMIRDTDHQGYSTTESYIDVTAIFDRDGAAPA